MAKQATGLGPDDATIQAAITAQGQISGTLQYMSPEQLQGKEADARSDIFAFGCVLYEMLSGKKAFSGANAASVIAAIMQREPEPLKAAPPLDRVIRTCLAKDPDQRFQTALDLKRNLLWAAESESASPAPSRARFGKAGWIAAAVLVVAGAGWYRATRPVAQPLKPLVRFDVDLGTGASFTSTGGADTILSPDGTRLAYVSQGKLFTRRMDQPRATELAGTERAYAPFFSPDGQWVAFFTPGKLKKISVEGGASVDLCSAANPAGGAWGEDGNIIAALTVNSPLSRIPSAGGTPASWTELAPGEISQRWPQILPGGKAILFTSSRTATGAFDGANIEVASLAGPAADRHPKTLVRGGTFGRYLPSSNGTGHLIYINKRTLFAMPFDPDKLEVHGTPAPVLEEIGYNTQYGSAQFDFSLNGTLVYRGSVPAEANLVTVQWLDAAGKTQPLLAKPGVYQRPRLSPDGQRLAMDYSSDIWVYEARRDTMTRLTFGGYNIVPVWSPDGRYIVFYGRGGIWWVRSDGAGTPRLLIQDKNPNLVPWSFTLDGTRLAYQNIDPRTSYDIWTAAIEGGGAGLRAGKPELFLQTPLDERQPTFSPDGRWLAYTSDESGTYQVYVRAYPDKGGKWQISNAGGASPVWSGNERELFFRAEDNRIMVASYAAKGDSFMPDQPRVWSARQLANFGIVGVGNYDLAPDGKRVAALMPIDTSETQQTQNHVTFLLNFADELQRKVPTGK